MISDSSPIIFMAKINSLDILKKLYHNITIPQEVKEELLIEEKLDSKIISKAIEEGWIKIESQNDKFNLKLGKGEDAAISLAKEKNDSILIDDALGIKAANSFNIKIIRTTTVILLALKKKLINKKEAHNLINKLIESGYYISPNYYSLLITKLAE